MKCPKCGFEQEEGDICQMCGIVISKYLKHQEGIAFQEREKAKGIPWENRARLGFMKALISTLKEVLFSPVQFFKKMPTTGGFGEPIFYAIVIGWIGLLGGLLWQWLMGKGSDLRLSLPISIILAPICVVIVLFIGSGILHLMMLLFGAAKSGFEATFRVVVYSYSPAVFNLVPFVGSFVGGIWCLVLEVIGLREAHQTTTGKAVAAVLLPGVVAIILVVLIGIIVVGILKGLRIIPKQQYPSWQEIKPGSYQSLFSEVLVRQV